MVLCSLRFLRLACPLFSSPSVLAVQDFVGIGDLLDRGLLVWRIFMVTGLRMAGADYRGGMGVCMTFLVASLINLRFAVYMLNEHSRWSRRALCFPGLRWPTLRNDHLPNSLKIPQGSPLTFTTGNSNTYDHVCPNHEFPNCETTVGVSVATILDSTKKICHLFVPD